MVVVMWWFGAQPISSLNPAITPNNLPPPPTADGQMKEIVEDGHLHRLGLAQRSWAGCRALDVGAAPGGWTQYLSERVAGLARVVAVDGGRLHPGVLARGVVRYVGCKVQDEAAQAALAAEVGWFVGGVGAGARSSHHYISFTLTQPIPITPPSFMQGPFALVASDVNAYPEEMAELIARHVLPYLDCEDGTGGLGDGALLALTLKFPRKPTPEREAACVANALRVLGEGGQAVGVAVAAHRCVWLHANSANERTLLAVVVRGQGKGKRGE